MKVEHHVTIHSGLDIHAPVFAESREEAERLGREWALALLTKTPPADAFFEPPDRLLYVRYGRCCPALRLRQVRRHRDPRLQGRDQHRHRRCGLCGTSGHVLIRTGDVTLSNLAVNGEPVTETTTLAPGAALSGIRLLNVLALGDYDATAHVTAIQNDPICYLRKMQSA